MCGDVLRRCHVRLTADRRRLLTPTSPLPTAAMRRVPRLAVGILALALMAMSVSESSAANGDIVCRATPISVGVGVSSLPNGQILVLSYDGVLRLNADCSIDATFGVNGFVRFDRFKYDHTKPIVQPDGKILIPGTDWLRRYTAEGLVDPDFGAGSGLLLPGPLVALALAPDGKIVVASTSTLARYDADGSIDTTFGVNGVVTTDTGQSEQTGAVAIQPGRGIVIGGQAIDSGSQRSVSMLRRYDESGTADPGFGTNGTVYTDFASTGAANALVINVDGTIVAAAGANLARYLPDGTLDDTFGYGGIVPTEGAFVGMDLRADGTIVTVDADAIVVRQYALDGTPDEGFGSAGRVNIPPANFFFFRMEIVGMAAQPDGSILVTVSYQNSGPTRTEVIRIRSGLHPGPFGGTPQPIPGRLEAENYDIGGQGIGYLDTTPGNTGGGYRSDDVDIKPSREDGYAVGWFAAGEWLAYTVNVEAAGDYDVTARVGSALPDRTFHIEVDGADVTGPVAVPQTADWDEYATVRAGSLSLTAGTHVLRVVVGPDDFMDLQWVDIVSAAPRHVVPGRIEAEDYDDGGNGVGYFDTTPGNEGGAYRAGDVDIKESSEGGYAVGWFAAGEWLAYSVDVPSDGAFAISARVGSLLPDRTFYIEVDGSRTIGPIAVPQVEDWDRYVTISAGSVGLSSGRHVLRVVMGPQDFMDLQWISIDGGAPELSERYSHHHGRDHH
jgi:uncharacterized delta-60 repeat protein